MPNRYLPPTRKSISMNGAVNPLGPHQRFACSGSVHAFHTRSRGASNVRAITSSLTFAFSLGCFLVLLGIVFPPGLSGLGFLCSLPQVLGQPVEPVLPEDAVPREPAERGTQRRRIDLDPVHATLGRDLDQARLLED